MVKKKKHGKPPLRHDREIDELPDQSNMDIEHRVQRTGWTMGSGLCTTAQRACQRPCSRTRPNLQGTQGFSHRAATVGATVSSTTAPEEPTRPEQQGFTTLSRRTGKSLWSDKQSGPWTSLCTTTGKSARPAQQGNRPPCPRTRVTLCGHKDHGERRVRHATACRPPKAQ